MVRGIKAVLAKRGLDPRDFALLAFAGAGPVHAALLAREIGTTRVVIPFLPGSFSAYGILTADVRLDVSQGLVGPLRVCRERVLRTMRALRRRAEAGVRRHGFRARATRYLPSADRRYHGERLNI